MLVSVCRAYPRNQMVFTMSPTQILAQQRLNDIEYKLLYDDKFLTCFCHLFQYAYESLFYITRKNDRICIFISRVIKISI